MKKRIHPQGFSLVEVTLAIGIAAFCLLAVFALLPVGLDSNRESHRHTAAAALATDVVADLRATALSQTAGAVTTSPVYKIPVPSASLGFILYLNEDGSSVVNPTDNDGGPVYRTTVTVTNPQTTTPRQATTAAINITWAASTNPGQQSPAGSYQTVVGIDRN
jgi:uncharacterized protein (TIGR02598 family)